MVRTSNSKTCYRWGVIAANRVLGLDSDRSCCTLFSQASIIFQVLECYAKVHGTKATAACGNPMRCPNWIVFEDIRTLLVTVFHFILNCRAVSTSVWEAAGICEVERLDAIYASPFYTTARIPT
jgi:hypothetical protein